MSFRGYGNTEAAARQKNHKSYGAVLWGESGCLILCLQP